MKKNVHDTERIIRFAAGVVITSLAFVGPANNWYLLGILPLLTGLIGTCPLYSALGVSTRRGETALRDSHHHYVHKV